MSVFVPEDGRPARLIRYTDVMPVSNILSLFFRATNTLVIDKAHWERLDWIDRHQTLRTEYPCLEIAYPPHRAPVITQRSK